MAENKNLAIYEAYAEPPQAALKTIGAGKLKGFTDVNPMWRIKALTELFGPVGFGWYTKTTRQWLEEGKDGRVAAFCNLELYVYDASEKKWSAPIEGTGGSMLVNIFKGQPETSDEAFKMAYTDALSVACKSLGIAAHVYWAQGRTKYSTEEEPRVTEDHLASLATMVKNMNAAREAVGAQLYTLRDIMKAVLKDKAPEAADGLTITQYDACMKTMGRDVQNMQNKLKESKPA